MRLFLLALLMSIFLGLLGIGYWAVNSFGLGGYVNSLVMTHTLSDSKLRGEAIRAFAGASGEYKGVFAGIYFSNVWIWREYRLEYFHLGIDPSYSEFIACGDPALFQSDITNEKRVKQYVTQDRSKWLDRVKPGQYVDLVFFSNNVQEIRAYDWPVFMPLGLKSLCGN